MKNSNILSVYIVEDDPLIAETIKMSLQENSVLVLGISESYEQALPIIKKCQPTITLLDINLEGNKDGVDLALHLDKYDIPYLFLTSQTDVTTIARVKLTNPLGFIVKPFTESGLLSNIELAWHKISLQKEEYISIRTNGQRIKLNQFSILFLQAFDNYCYIHTLENKYLVPHTLKATLENLNNDIFKKTHRSYVVNSKRISGIKSKCVIIESRQVPLSTSFKKQFKELL